MRRSTLIVGAVLWAVAIAAVVWMVRGGAGSPNGPEIAALPRAGGDMEIVETSAGKVAIPKPTVEMTIPDGWEPPQVEGFTLVNQNGEQVTAETLAGRQYVIGYIFTRCQYHCPDLLRRMRDVREQLGDFDGRLVTVTVDPEYDTPEKMAKHAEIYAFDVPTDNWQFLTGEPEELLKIIRFGSQQLPSEPPTIEDSIGPEVAHSLSLMHVGADGQLKGAYDYRSEDDVRQLRRVLRGDAETSEMNAIRPPLKEMVPVEGGTPSRETDPQPTGDATGAVSDQNTPIDGIAAIWPVAFQPVRAESGEKDNAAGLDVGQRLVAGRTDDPLAGLPAWARKLPAVNAGLNAVATLLLVAGFAAIKSNNAHRHRNLMVAAVFVSAAFLASYLTYHWALGAYTTSHGRPFTGTGWARPLYYSILITHVLLAIAVPVLVAIALWRAYTKQWQAHKRITRWTYPIWLYVSVTGVVIYGMLYHWPQA